ncbi:MAG: type I-E CRISPR-associated protein Cas7/Cse4/CasC [Stellaceae bacterium]
MVESRFLQIHTLTSYPGALLNRDDAGLAKRLPFGGATRARISSQCQKRRWRMADDEWALRHIPNLTGQDFGIRSRRIFSDRIASPLIDEGFAPSAVIEVVGLLRERLFPKASDEKSEDSKENGTDRGRKGRKDREIDDTLGRLRFEQAFLMGLPEIDYLTILCRRILSGDNELRKALDEKPKTKNSTTPFQKSLRSDLTDNLQVLAKEARLPKSLEAALFGRMITSDILANTDAAIHVAHAFTVHAIERELDFMTAVDDLKDRDDDAGAAGMFDMELASGLYYGYVVVDVPLLVANLAEDREIAAKVVEHLLHLIAQVSPGAKKGSTAPYAWAEFVLVEAGRRQPRTLANAFRQPIDLRRFGNRFFEEAVACLAGHLEKLDGAYGAHEARSVLNLAEAPIKGAEPRDLDCLAAWAAQAVRAGAVQ